MDTFKELEELVENVILENFYGGNLMVGYTVGNDDLDYGVRKIGFTPTGKHASSFLEPDIDPQTFKSEESAQIALADKIKGKGVYGVGIYANMSISDVLGRHKIDFYGNTIYKVLFRNAHKFIHFDYRDYLAIGAPYGGEKGDLSYIKNQFRNNIKNFSKKENDEMEKKISQMLTSPAYSNFRAKFEGHLDKDRRNTAEYANEYLNNYSDDLYFALFNDKGFGGQGVDVYNENGFNTTRRTEGITLRRTDDMAEGRLIVCYNINNFYILGKKRVPDKESVEKDFPNVFGKPAPYKMDDMMKNNTELFKKYNSFDKSDFDPVLSQRSQLPIDMPFSELEAKKQDLERNSFARKREQINGMWKAYENKNKRK